MAGSFPTSVTAYTNPGASDVTNVAVGSRTHSQFHSDVCDDIEQIMTKLGTGSSTASADTVLRGTGSGITSFGTIATAMIAANAITTRLAIGVGTTTPTTTNTAIAAIADPTLTINCPVTSDVLVWMATTFNDGTGNALVGYYLRIDGGSWQQVIETSQPSSAGRWSASGFHIFPSVTTGAKVIEIGNSSNTSANTITHYPTPRRLLAIGVAR